VPESVLKLALTLLLGGLAAAADPHESFTITARDEGITLDRRSLEEGEARQQVRRFDTVAAFLAAFDELEVHRDASIEIRGIWDREAAEIDREAAEAILEKLRQRGYEESAFRNLKRYYGPAGNHFVEPYGADGAITWRSSVIVDRRIERRVRSFESIAAFERGFFAAEIPTEAEIEVHAPLLKDPAETAKSQRILRFLATHGYAEAGPISN